MRFQFQIDGRAAGPMLERWQEAACDAVSDGYATWGTPFETIFLDHAQGAQIKRFAVITRTQEYN